MGFREIKLTVGGALDVPEEVVELKAWLQRTHESSTLQWELTVLAVDEPGAASAVTELRRALASELLAD